MIGEGIQLLTSTLFQLLNIIEDPENGGAKEDKVWQAQIQQMYRELKKWEVKQLGKQTFSLEFEMIINHINDKIKARNQ